jgi:hypothetical protein
MLQHSVRIHSAVKQVVVLGSWDYMFCTKTHSVTVYVTTSAVRTVVLLGATSYIHTRKSRRVRI